MNMRSKRGSMRPAPEWGGYFDQYPKHAQAAAFWLVVNTGEQASPYATEVARVAIELLGDKSRPIEWHDFGPDDRLELLLVSDPNQFMDRIDAMVAENPAHCTWLVDTLLMVARDNVPCADRARALARKLAIEE